MSKEKLAVGDVRKIQNGAGPEEIKIVGLTQWHVSYVVRTPKGRWGRKETEISRQMFWRQAV